MQKQTMPSIKAHLLRSAFILLLLVGVCTMPFALVGGIFNGGVNKNVETAVAGATPTPTPTPTSSTWRPIGPAPISTGFTNFTVTSGRVDVAVSDPRNPNVMYIGTGSGGGPGGGGIWKTSNYLTADAGGPTWVPLTDDFPSLSIFGKSLALYRANPDILYAAAGGPNGGVLKTVDGGAHWEYLLSDVFSSALFSAVVIHPTDPNKVYVAVRGSAEGGTPLQGGVYRLKFANGGWTATNLTWRVAPGSVATDVLINPDNPQILYTGLVKATDSTKNGIYESLDGGNTWQLLSNGLLSGSQVGEWIALAMAPSSPQIVYTTIFKPENSPTFGVLRRFVTTDAGSSWSMMNQPLVDNNPQPEKSDFRFWHVVLGVDPVAPNTVYVNAKEPFLVASTDFGQRWRIIYRDEDPVNAYFDSTGALAYVGDRGIQRAPAPFEPNPTFVCKQGNLGNFLFYNVALDPSDPRRGFGVSQDQIDIARFTGGPTWTYVIDRGQGIGSEVGKVLIDPQDPDFVYNRSELPPNGTFLTRSTDGGITWATISNGIDIREFSTGLPNQAPNNAFALEENRPSRLVLGGQRVWQTLDRGANWTHISELPLSTGGSITAIAIAPSRGETLYAATGDGHFYATFDGGMTWPERDQGLPAGPANATQDIMIDPANPNRVFIETNGLATNGRLWTTNDGGSSWTKLDGDLPPNLLVWSLAVDWRFHRPTLYAGTSRGVFFSADSGRHWAPFGQGLPRTLVYGFQILPRYDMLVAATYGRGVYQTHLWIPDQ